MPEDVTIRPEPDWQFRISGYYSDDATPPKVGGELAEQCMALDILDRDEMLGAICARADVAKVLVEERVRSDVHADPAAGWREVRTWMRDADGRWSHS